MVGASQWYWCNDSISQREVWLPQWAGSAAVITGLSLPFDNMKLYCEGELTANHLLSRLDDEFAVVFERSGRSQNAVNMQEWFCLLWRVCLEFDMMQVSYSAWMLLDWNQKNNTGKERRETSDSYPVLWDLQNCRLHVQALFIIHCCFCHLGAAETTLTCHDQAATSECQSAKSCSSSSDHLGTDCKSIHPILKCPPLQQK